MKRTILFLALVFIATGSVFAQKNNDNVTQQVNAKTATPAGTADIKIADANDEAIAFKVYEHDFGTIAEGPAVSYDFEFTNNSTQPVQLQSVRASCGCTTPNWSKDEILPGATSKITATYNTQGRPGNFYKTITVKSTAGQKILKIKGNVEKAPTSSVPANNNSMIKH